MRVLFVCTANISRSRTAEDLFRTLAWMLHGERCGHEVRSAGTHASGAGTQQLTAEDLEWADTVCVMEEAHREVVRARFPAYLDKVRILEVPDVYSPHDSTLRDALTTHIMVLLAEVGERRARGAGGA